MVSALRNLVDVGLELADASHRVSTFPADYLGLEDRGRIAPGLRADLVVLSPDLQLQQVWINGHPVDLHAPHR